MSPFEPVGDRARWRIVYDLLRVVPVDGVLEYEQMAEALDMDAEDDRHVIQMAMRRAGKELEQVEKHAIESISNVGYRVVRPPEHLRLARGHQSKAGKQLKRGHSKVVNVDFNEIEPETRKAFEVVAQAFAMQMQFNSRLDVRQKRLEEVVETVSERTERTASELAELRERMARLEGGEDEAPDQLTDD